jgi:hypothetical protein
MECKVMHTLYLGEAPRVSALFVARIVMWHIREDLLGEGYKVDQAAIHAIARVGGPMYVHARDPFRMDIPKWEDVVAERAGRPAANPEPGAGRPFAAAAATGRSATRSCRRPCSDRSWH